MFAVEARKMDYRVHAFLPASDTSAEQFADFETSANHEDLNKVKKSNIISIFRETE